jgi:two-component system nitrate/nitrite response regulator NarL
VSQPISPETPLRILIVDDHPVLRQGLAMLVAGRPDFRLVGEAARGSEAVRLAEREEPDIVLLDVDLGGESGLDLLPRLRTAAPVAKVIVLTGLRAPEIPQQALQLGARGLVLKDTAAELLLKAIEKVHAGEMWFDRATMQRLLANPANGGGGKPLPHADRLATLTEREREIVALIGEGLRNRRIAARLHLSEKTVRNHLTTIFSKLDVADRLELAVYAYRHGLATPPR